MAGSFRYHTLPSSLLSFSFPPLSLLSSNQISMVQGWHVQAPPNACPVNNTRKELTIWTVWWHGCFHGNPDERP